MMIEMTPEFQPMTDRSPYKGGGGDPSSHHKNTSLIVDGFAISQKSAHTLDFPPVSVPNFSKTFDNQKLLQITISDNSRTR